MSNLVKPYKIAVYDDVLGTNGFEEKRLGIIGSDTMIGLNRALEPNLVCNVNGQNKFSFKMYKKYVDPATGEQITNPFIDWLVSERKIKLEYDSKWYDFIIKDINENSSNYLYTYQLEDALVQELSKNGFGVTLDEKLMNNVGTSKQLGQFVMEETDWTVDGEVPVQTIEESLVYLKLKRNINAIHLLDQQKDANGDYSAGVTESNQTIGAGKTILAFYSSCKNKPHRFQFIYSLKGYNRTEDDGEYTYNIDRKDDRTISEKDCQYYIEFDNPEEDYTNPENLSNSDEDKLIKQFNLYLPTDYFTVETVFPITTNKANDEDTIISTWYRGARYGFSQQAQYIPLLERYCQKFEKNAEIPFEYENTWITFVSGSEPGNIAWQDNILSKESTNAGIGTTFDLADNEYLYYEGTIKIINGELNSLSWNGSPFVNEVYIQNLDNGEQWFSDEDKIEFLSSFPVGTNLHIKAKHIKRPGAGTRRVRLIPNIDDSTLISLEFNNFRMYRGGDYYGYTDSKFVSPTLIKNYITNSVFEGDGGWTATTSPTYSNQTSVTVEPVYCRINNNKHTTIVDDFLAGTYQEPTEDQENPYSSKMKMIFFNNKGFILNSCIKDNRTEIEEMPSGEEWILDYKIVNEAGDDVSSNFDITLGEYNYNTSLGGYEEKSTKDIDFTYEGLADVVDGTTVKYHRKKITVSEINNYSISTFKENSRIYLKISPKSTLGIPDTTNYKNDDSTKPLSTNFYIEKLSLYRKVLNDQNEIIEPDFESDESQSAEEYINSGTIEHKYKYFNEWYVNSDNPNAYTDKEELPTITRTTLSYEEFKPVYNVGAEKVRSISQKESNYFNILQSIAETFEQWLVINVDRNNEDGTILPGGKKISFKNYRGDNNYACFRYGVNLKDIQRTYSSKNIVTKLMVKPNNNKNAKDGFCTIQRAGSNPTGENYIYDFQYYQNKGIMDVEEYLNQSYNLDQAQGPDGELWDERVTTSESYNLNGYFHRLKKINDTLLPLNEDLIGVRADLLERRAEKKVIDNTIEAAETSIEQVRKDFKQLIGVYPDEIQQDDIKSIEIIEDGPKYGENWYTYDTALVVENGIYTGISVDIIAQPSDKKLPFTVNFDPAAEDEIIESNDQKNKYEFIKNHPYGGAYVSTESGYQNDSEYRLTYNFYITEDSADVVNIGCHNSMFASGFSISIEDQNGDIVQKDSENSSSNRYTFTNKLTPLSKYTATIQGVVNNNSENQPYFWIQPNRGLSTGPVGIQLSNINLELINGNPAESTQDRAATVYVKAKLNIEDGEETTANSFIEKTYQVEIDLPAGATSASCVQTVATVDMEDPDVRTYIEEYTLLQQKLNRASEEKISIDSVIAQKEAELQQKNARIDTILNYKKALNHLFYQRYSRFIQEGTWISEEYVDDEKYYIDAQSVLYNSCYPQVTYAINVLELSQLPGYEMFKFELGDKTWAIDEDFFGDDGKEEVIITEMSEMLEDPSKNTIKVQNFKNQFQDLFQKITATVQQTQYNSGSYEKGSALMNATAEERGQFVINSINGAAEYLTPGYGHTVTIGNDGITIIDDKTNTNKLRLVGGAILFGETDKVTNEDTWTTGITNKGISADLINAGQINTNVIQIRNGNDSLFNWDSKGISAYSSYENQTGIDKNKFVRFDKYGIYGIDHAEGVNDSWKANSNDEINNKATFALTWEGLKVTGNDGITALIGRQDDNIMLVQKPGLTSPVFSISNNGEISTTGITIIDGQVNVNGTNYPIASGEDITSLQNQIDGQITTYFEPHVPNNRNYPVTDHDNDEDKKGWSSGTWKNHNGDLFYITSPGGQIYIKSNEPEGEAIAVGDYWVNGNVIKKYQEAETPGTYEWAVIGEDEANIVKKVGYCYRWQFNSQIEDSGTEDEIKSNWVLITDTEVTKALADAAQAQAAADGKMTFYNLSDGITPQIGDLLIPKANDGDYLKGKVYRWEIPEGKETAEWIPLDYTNDDAFNNFLDDSKYTKITDLTNEISEGGDIFASGLSNTANAEIINKFELKATSIIVYNNEGADEANIIFSAQGTKDANGNYVAGNGAVYLAGWTVTNKQLSTGELGTSDCFFLMPQGQDATIAAFDSNTKTYKMVVGNQFALDDSGKLYCNGGKLAGWDISQIGIGKTTSTGTNGDYDFELRSDEQQLMPSLVKPDKNSPVRMAVGGLVSVDGDATILRKRSTYYVQNYDTKTITFTISLEAEQELVSAQVDGVSVLVAGWSYNQQYTASIDIDNSKITVTCNDENWFPANQNDPEVNLAIDYTYYYSTSSIVSTPAFRLLADGSLYASAIKMVKGQLGPLSFSNKQVKSVLGESVFQLNQDPDVQDGSSINTQFGSWISTDSKEFIGFNVANRLACGRWGVLVNGWHFGSNGEILSPKLIYNPADTNHGDLWHQIKITGDGIYVFNGLDDEHPSYDEWTCILSFYV